MAIERSEVVLLGREPSYRRISQPHLVEPDNEDNHHLAPPVWPYLGVVVVVETDVCECPEEEEHDCERDGLTDGAEHHAQVVVEDEGPEKLDKVEEQDRNI